METIDKRDMEKGISIITVTYNNKDGLIKTIKNVASQDYQLKEFIVIDGNSTDGTKEVLEQYKDVIDVTICEPDNGIYDAMNKGVRLASKEWIIMLNAGDIFSHEHVLSNVFNLDFPSDVSFLYSDYYDITQNGKTVINHVDRHKGIVFHQASIYKKSLHEKYGYYLQTHPYIVSDLLFFLSVPEELFYKIPTLISINDTGGISRKGMWIAEEALGMRIGFGIEHIITGALKYIKLRVLKALKIR